jgi:hypothetical protein
MAVLSVKRLAVAVLCGATALASAFAGYFYAKHESDKEALQNLYLNSALAAKLDATILSEFRSGETEKALKFLSSLLEGELITLNFYEKNLSPSERSLTVYENVAVVRAYYERFPEAERPNYGKEGLALKRQ